MGNERFIFWVWESPRQVDLHAMSKNTFIVLQYASIFTLLAQRLPKDSLNDSFFQTPPLRDTNLRCLVDWSYSEVESNELHLLALL